MKPVRKQGMSQQLVHEEDHAIFGDESKLLDSIVDLRNQLKIANRRNLKACKKMSKLDE